MSLKNRIGLAGTMAFLTGCFVSSSAIAQQQSANLFINEGKNIPGYPDADKRFVFLNSGVAAMAQQAYGLPKDTTTYSLMGMTIFPYYQASEPLKAFLNNTSIFGMPVSQFPSTPNIPQISLPATDMVNRSIPIPNGAFQKHGAEKMAVVDKKTKDEVPWMVAQGGQAFQVPGDSEALALVAPGSMFSACAARTMVLRCGLMWIMTGTRAVAVLTKNGAVAIKPYSIAAVEATWFNELRVTALHGPALEVQLAYDGKTDKVTVEHGKEISVAESLVATSGQQGFLASREASNSNHDAPKSEPAPDSVHTPLTISVPGLQAHTSSIVPRKSDLLRELTIITPPFSTPRMSTDYSRMLASFGITPAIRRAEIQKQYLQKNNIASKSAINNLAKRAAAIPRNNTKLGNVVTTAENGLPTAAGKMTNATAHTEAVLNSAAGQTVETASLSGVNQGRLPTAELRTLRLSKGRARLFTNTEINVEQGGIPYFTLGEAVFVADQPLVIKTGTFTVHMRAGAKVQMVARKDVILVRNLAEEQLNSVKIRMGNHIFDCGVGGELIAGTNAPAIFDEMRIDGIARRNVASTEALSGCIIVNKCEVSLTSLMQQSPLMRQLYKSRDESDKRIISDLMKTIVAMNMVTGARGAYRRISGLHGIQ